MTLDQNIRLFRKWWWLIVLAAVVGGGVGYFLRNRQAPTYQATAIMSFGDVLNPNVGSSNFIVGSDLAQTYSELVRTNTIINNTISSLNLPLTTDELRADVDYKLSSGAPLLDIVVTYSNPVLSAAIANEVANELLLNAPSGLTTDQQKQIQDIQSEIDSLKTEIKVGQARLDSIQQALGTATNAGDIADLNAQHDVATTQLANNRATLAQFETNLTDLQNRTSPVQIYEKAAVPDGAQNKGTLQAGLLAAGVAASLTIGVVLLVTYFDNSNVHTSEDIAKNLSVPVLASITRYGNSKETESEKLVSHEPLRVEILEAFRLLFMRLMAPKRGVPAGKQNDTIIVASPAPGDGKSLVSSNLAVTAALFGKRVLLIDADLRRPTIHKIFGLPNEIGLANLVNNVSFVSAFLGDPKQVTELSQRADLGGIVGKYIQQSDVTNLKVMTSGVITESSGKEMSLVFQAQWLAIFKACADVDVIIIDTPPALAVADSSVLAAKTGAHVVLVLTAGKTSMRIALKAREQFVKVGAQLEGLVLNMVDQSDIEFEYKNYGGDDTLTKMIAQRLRAKPGSTKTTGGKNGSRSTK